jgi:hypothetical protein
MTPLFCVAGYLVWKSGHFYQMAETHYRYFLNNIASSEYPGASGNDIEEIKIL